MKNTELAINVFFKEFSLSPQPFRYWEKFTPEEIPAEIIGAQMCVWDIEEKADSTAQIKLLLIVVFL